MSHLLLEDEADFVIVGTGAGGATAARVLSQAGHGVIMLEEGPSLRPEERRRGLLDAMEQSMRSLATLTTTGTTPFPLLSGRCVGGSTAINSGIIWRMPDGVRDEWQRDHGLAPLVGGHALDDAFATIERELGIGRAEARVLGGNGERMRSGSEALGLPGRPTRRNAPNCEGSGRCLQGCPRGARQSMDVSYVPRAVADGARLHALCRATRVRMESGRAVGVEGSVLEEDGERTRGRFFVRARRAVVLAAGALHTPVLLWKSGLRTAVGEGYSAHPGAAVVGEFDETVGMGFGATQSWEVPLHERGFKLESLSLPPELLAARLPGAGDSWQRLLGRLDRFAQFCVVVRMRARGRVRPGVLGGVNVRYEPMAEDVEKLRQGTALLTRMMFAAGARCVYPGVSRLPERFVDPEEADRVLDARVRRSDFHLMASHHFGGACAGVDARSSVVGPDLQSYAARHLYVMDGSVFPTNLGVNPQHSIMGVAHVAAARLANAERRPSVAA